mmetsp:Transcript_23089/g.57361  ORF Transcript_23089/g.57361 Transcript_23089/m.57361 type:complete len:102 (+) Transcript_23089:690-995(+)
MKADKVGLAHCSNKKRIPQDFALKGLDVSNDSSRLFYKLEEHLASWRALSTTGRALRCSDLHGPAQEKVQFLAKLLSRNEYFLLQANLRLKSEQQCFGALE